MIIVTPPYPFFPDLEGNGLNAGYLYFGAVNTNPEIVTNQTQVFWDADLRIPAVQPVRTIAGFPSRNGSPGILYSSSDYSLTVRDSARRLISYSRNSAEFSASAYLSQRYNTQHFTATEGQTVFNLTFSYTPGANAISVYRNGARMRSTVDFNESSATSITLTTGAVVDDEISIIAGSDLAPLTVNAENVAYIPLNGNATNVDSYLDSFNRINICDYGALPGSGNTINAAITALIADLTDYSEIYVPAGDFYIDDADGAARVANGLNAPGYSTPTLFTIQNLTYLKFGGPGRLIVNGSRNLNLFDFVNITSLDLDSLNIKGNRDADPADILFFGIAGDLIRVRGSGGSFTKYLRVHNCHLTHAPISPLRVMRAVYDCVVTGNNFDENTSTIRFGEDVVGLPEVQRPRRFIFDGNIVSNTVADACMEVRYIAQDVSISNNQLRTYPGDDVFEYANDNTALVGTPVHTQGVSVRGGPAGRGYVRSVSITGNTIRAISNGGYVARGVTLLDTAGYDFAEGCIVGQNDIEGLVVVNGANIAVVGNPRIYGNVTKDDDSGDVTIKGNTITVPPAVTLSISGNTIANPTVVTTTANHNLMTGDTARISGSNSTPTIDGDRVVTVLSPTTFSVAVNVTVAGTTGTVKHDYDTKAIFTAEGAYQAIIQDNDIFSAADTTMLTVSSEQQIIKGNTLRFTGAATGNLNAAIRSVTGNLVDIKCNTVVNADGSGIVLASVNGPTSLASIDGNTIKTAGNRGLQITSGVTEGTIHVRGNDVGVATNGNYLNQATGTVYEYADNSWASSGYTVATVPSAAAMTGKMIYVNNESGGAVMAFSDGTNWRRLTDRAIIS